MLLIPNVKYITAIKFYTQEAEELLARVKLTEKAEVRSRSYSGGMKRRLSVAIALIGDPKLVILDEPVLDDAQIWYIQIIRFL